MSSSYDLLRLSQHPLGWLSARNWRHHNWQFRRRLEGSRRSPPYYPRFTPWTIFTSMAGIMRTPVASISTSERSSTDRRRLLDGGPRNASSRSSFKEVRQSHRPWPTTRYYRG